jgi:S-(hydroxymethyl)glutathione dehydrogenase/alcohol dehydrogenase
MIIDASSARISASILHATGASLEWEEVDLDVPQAGEVQVRIGASGVCHTDLNAQDGTSPTPMPAILGHEGAGTVVAIGPEVDLAVGARVALTWLVPCGLCEECLRGLGHLCPVAWRLSDAGGLADGTSRFSRDGAAIKHYAFLSTFAEQVVVPAACCIPLPDRVPDEIAALVGCAVTTGLGAVWNTAAVKPRDSVAVIGCGGVGLSAIMAAKAAGSSRVIAVDAIPAKLEAAVELGATDQVVASEDPAETARSIAAVSGGGVDFAFEATGRPEAMLAGAQATRPRGTAVLIGISPPNTVLPLPAALFRAERRVVGSVYGSSLPRRDFPVVFAAYEAGILPLDRLISHRLPLSEAERAFDLLRAGEARRIVLQPTG